MRGSLRSDCASTAAVTVTPLIAIATVEIIFVSLAFLSLHEKYIYVKTEFSAALPTLSDLEEAVCDHWENVLVTDKGATGTALGLAQDMLTRGKVECKTSDYVENGAADSSFANSGVAANDGRQLLQAMRQVREVLWIGRMRLPYNFLPASEATVLYVASLLERKEKGKNNQQFKRRLWIPVIKVAGFHELLELWEEARDGASLRGAPTRTSKEWSQLSTAVQTYIDSTAVVDDDMIYYFGWLASGWRSAS
eukprot:gene10131-biopygen10363